MTDRNATGCQLCGHVKRTILEAETALVRWFEPHKLVRCERCGLVYVHPQPDVHDLTRRYAQDEFYAVQARHGIGPIGGTSEIPRCLEERLAEIESLVPGRRLLDAGAGRGAFLQHARGRGWQVLGVEPSEAATRFAKEQWGLDVLCSTLDEAPLPVGAFDVVHLNHVLEHLPRPLDTLALIRQTLADDGLLVLEVPNEFGDLFGLVRAMVLRERPLPYLAPSYHLFFFTPRTISQVLRKAGFSPVRLRTPRRNRCHDSRFVAGRYAKALIYRAEEALRMGPAIEVFAKKG
ncbi:MAG: class I SAM-dependent methyltransferase [Candidatus Riflebacteria bacterium]|nr:class I SAM-dependent methyltransferase [Candidatus Riflebacteria bacterium]